MPQDKEPSSGTLDFYRKVLPERCPADSLEDEIGPVVQAIRADLAEEYLEDRFHLGNACVRMESGMDWYAAANGDLEWTCALARHHHVLALARAYRRTGREAFAEKALSQVTHWIDHVHKPDLPEEAFLKVLGDDYLIIKRSHWRPLETAFRIGETWLLALPLLIDSPAMTPARWDKILDSIRRQGAYLHRYRWKVGNHAYMEAAMLTCCAMVFREVDGTAEWKAHALKFLTEGIDRMFFADGYSREVSGGYNWVAKKGYVSVWKTAERNGGVERVFSPAVRARLATAFKAELYHLKPDFTVPVTNDSNFTCSRERHLRILNSILQDPEIDYVLQRGAKGRAPAAVSYHYPDAGLVVMRSDWSAQGHYLFFDTGPKGGHVIGDQLSVEICAYGVPVLANAGRWRYTTSFKDVDWMDWALYFKSSASCNTVLPAGATQDPDDAQNEVCSFSETLDRAVGVFCNGYLTSDGSRIELSHRREVMFVKEVPCWVVRDTVTGAAPAILEQHWHFLPGFEVVEQDDVLQARQDALTFYIAQAAPTGLNLLRGSEQPIGGWMCPDYAVKIPAWEAVYSTEKAAAAAVTFTTLLLPQQGAEGQPPQLHAVDGGVNIGHRGRSWTVTV